MSGPFLILVFVGSAMGGLFRHLVGAYVLRVGGTRFPFGTLVVNVSGAGLIGFVWAFPLAPSVAAVAMEWREFLMFGLLGGYTTVSSFSLQTIVLMQESRWIAAGLNLGVSFFLCFGAVATGVSLGRIF